MSPNRELDFALLETWVWSLNYSVGSKKPVLRGRVLHELHCYVDKQFAAESIVIPIPQQEVYIKEFAAKELKD